ncbi:hypothetical protein SAMN05444007_10881 [Cribrihabitans marinus]|uniref:Uncharacterized protein n=1 Tax=Cribrihabitans marinus TaxID=1227549 RepID=A0A1H7CEJ6_9RHOB|nr:hypothetical protein SAMN05444007_10881 [Cribrihabitans marinus]
MIETAPDKRIHAAFRQAHLERARAARTAWLWLFGSR